MSIKFPILYSILSLAMISLIGCSTINDSNYAQLASQSSERIENILLNDLIKPFDQQGLVETSSLLLTDLVDVPELNEFVEKALVSNPSLQQSVVSLNLAYAQHGITSADRLPSVDASFSGQVEENANDAYTTEVSVSWELDLWQQLADTNNAALKDIASSQANLRGAQDLVVANIMRSWLDISLKQQLVEIETQRLTILENNETLVLERYRSGLGSLEELDNAKTSSASTRATLADYHEQLVQSKRSLVLLTGQWANSDSLPEVSSQFPSVLNPINIMPEQNLAGRPDLQSAFYNIEAESLRTEAAYKALLPSISLSASLSDMAESPSEALLTGPLWSVLGQISAPLFQGGKLKAQAELAELTTEQSYWIYQDTLLTAVNEVENAMGQEYSLELQQKHLDDALESAQRSFFSYEQKYRQGLVDIFDLLTVQQQTYDLEAQLVQAIYNRLVNRIDLGLALGLGVSA